MDGSTRKEFSVNSYSIKGSRNIFKSSLDIGDVMFNLL